jgi:hypothetical protein
MRVDPSTSTSGTGLDTPSEALTTKPAYLGSGHVIGPVASWYGTFVRVLLLPLALLGLTIAGCGSHVADDTGDPPTDTGDPPTDDGALADIELDDWCAPVQALGFEVRGAGRPMQLGACGHLYVHDGQHRLLHPDGHEEWLDTEVGSGLTVHLSATGHLVAWGEQREPVRLRDLRNDSPARASAHNVESFGFVRTLDPELGARLWTCGDGGLALDDTAGTEVLSPTADCNTIVAAGGRARLLFADASTSATVTTVDIDAGTLHATAVDDFENLFPTGIGEHADRLSISYDGRLAVHEAVVEVDDGAIGEPVVLGHRLIELASGQIISTCVYPTWLQAEHAGAPLWVRCNEDLFYFDDTLQRIDGTPSGTGQVAEQAGVLVIELDDLLVRLHPDAATLPETIAELSGSLRHLEISASGDAIAFVDGLTLLRWTATRGLEAFGTSRASAEWRIFALADDGQLLAWAQLDGDDQARPFVIDADGQRTDLDALGDSVNAEGTFADGRVLVRSSVHEPHTQSLVILDPSDRSASVVMGPTPADMPTLYLPADRAIDPRSQLVAGSIGWYEGALYFGNGL